MGRSEKGLEAAAGGGVGIGLASQAENIDSADGAADLAEQQGREHIERESGLAGVESARSDAEAAAARAGRESDPVGDQRASLPGDPVAEYSDRSAVIDEPVPEGELDQPLSDPLPAQADQQYIDTSAPQDRLSPRVIDPRPSGELEGASSVMDEGEDVLRSPQESVPEITEEPERAAEDQVKDWIEDEVDD